MPPHTRLSAIMQAGDEIEVKGKALWPRGVSLLTDVIGSAMQQHGYRIEPRSLLLEEAAGEREFSCRLVPVGR
jgi:hypothetical protein